MNPLLDHFTDFVIRFRNRFPEFDGPEIVAAEITNYPDPTDLRYQFDHSKFMSYRVSDIPVITEPRAKNTDLVILVLDDSASFPLVADFPWIDQLKKIVVDDGVIILLLETTKKHLFQAEGVSRIIEETIYDESIRGKVWQMVTLFMKKGR